MIAEIDYAATEPRDFQLTDDGIPFDGTGFTVALQLLQVGGLVWAASTVYAVGELVRPTIGNGLLYRVTVAGTTDVAEPTWPTTPAGTVVDGTVTFEEFTPTVAWQTQALGIVRVSGLDQLPRDTSYRVRYVVTDNFGATAPFPNKSKVDIWRVAAPFAG